MEEKNMDEQTILSLARQNAESADSLSDIFCTSLKGRVALVTGGATGLGYNVVHRLAEAGAKVVIASRKEERGQKAVREFTEQGYTVSWIRTDVSKVSDCQNAVDYTVKTYEKIDILVANAAGWSNYSYLDVTEKEYDRILDTDLKGAYFIGQAAARAMVRDKIKGKIIFISSAAHLGDGPSHTVMNTFYIAAKSGVAGMTKGIAGELRQYGIGVNCVAPGGMLSAGVFTEGSEAAALYGPEYEETRKLHGKDTPVTMNPDEVARVVYAMCTPMSDFMCGAVVDVNGGATLNFQEKPFSYTVEGCIPGPQR
ncbi:SDR family NAD(P)-dependent oxidoreductase [Lactonifactor longoviformis]|nr:SDR family NAD(P)-dependent oxidoreductase [Lactonifactor longoviformis]